MELAVNILLFFIILSIGLVFTNNREYGGTKDEPSCLPSNVLFIWHTSSGEDASFFQQRRLIITLITDLPHDTNVSLVTVGANVNKEINFKKDTSSTWWVTVMQIIPGDTGNHIIPYLKISSAIFSYLDKYESLKTAEEVFLIVNNNSVLDDESNAIQALEKKKTFIVLSGNQTDNNMEVWVNVATDKSHIILFDYSIEDINGTVESILILYCHDSRLFCDTDRYWTGTRCYRCSYICSRTCKNPSEYCLRACPYFCHSLLGTDLAVAHQEDKESLKRKNDGLYLFLNAGLPTIIVIIILPVVFFLIKRRKRIMNCIILKKKTSIVPPECMSLIAEEVNRHSEYDIELYNRTHSMSQVQPVHLPLSSMEASESQTENQENTYSQLKSGTNSDEDEHRAPNLKTYSDYSDMELKIFLSK